MSASLTEALTWGELKSLSVMNPLLVELELELDPVGPPEIH
jgi:hypothetical protein